MLRTIVVVLGLLLSGMQTASAAAPWELPPGIKALTVNGYPMAFLERGEGQTVVLVHGFGPDYRVWRRQTATPPPGFRLIAVSLRHSYPERWDGKGNTFTIAQHAEDLAAFIEGLGAGPVHLVAHSRGGVVAFWVARTRPNLVRKLVLMEASHSSWLQEPNSTPSEGSIRLNELRQAVAVRFEKGDIDGGLELWADRDTPGSWRKRTEEDRQRSRENAWVLIAPSSPTKPVTCADVASLAMPVLLMQGEKTPRRFATTVDATHKCLPSAERVIIPGAGHVIQGGNPKAFEAELVKFLSNGI